MVSKEDREAYENGRKEADFIRDHPINYLFAGGIHSRPSDPSKAEAYDKGISEKQLDEDKGSSGGGGICYLTTACIEAMNLPDNCLELRTLRNFRDNILMTNPSGRRAVKEYYRIASDIVQAVNEQDNAQTIWKNLYRDIKQAVSLVLSKDFEGAFENYRKMALNLKEKYL